MGFTRHQCQGQPWSYDLQQVQEAVGEALDRLANNEILRSVLLEGVVLTSGTPVDVKHGLGRPYRGWHVVDATVATSVFRDAASTTDPTAFVSLDCSVSATVSLVVF